MDLEQVRLDAKNNKLPMGNAAAMLKDVLDHKQTVGLTRYGVIEAYIVPAELIDEPRRIGS